MDGSEPCDLLVALYDTAAPAERAMDLVTATGEGDAMGVRPWMDASSLAAFGVPHDVARRVLRSARMGRFALIVRVEAPRAARVRSLLAGTGPTWMEQDHARLD